MADCLGQLSSRYGREARAEAEITSAVNHGTAPFARLQSRGALIAASRDQQLSGKHLAWDAARIVVLSGWGYLAGYLSESDAWDWILEIAIEVQRGFLSWEEFGAAVAIWQRAHLAERDEPIERILDNLLTAPESPWLTLPWQTPLRRPSRSVREEWSAAEEPRDWVPYRDFLPRYGEGPEPDTSMSIAVELSLECSECGRPVPLRSLSATVTCPTCLAVMNLLELDSEFWSAHLSDALGRARVDRTFQEATAGFTGALRFRRRCERAPISCGHCRTALGALDLDAALLHGGVDCHAPSCGGWIPVRRPDEVHAVDAGCLFLIGETGTSNERGSSGHELQSIVQTCVSCGAPLRIDGAERIVRCRHCQHRIFVPDALWIRVRAEPKTPRWYIVVRASTA
jgi:DNA-directed RNA polymerase subunit RPC12/RpoP